MRLAGFERPDAGTALRGRCTGPFGLSPRHLHPFSSYSNEFWMVSIGFLTFQAFDLHSCQGTLSAFVDIVPGQADWILSDQPVGRIYSLELTSNRGSQLVVYSWIN